MYMSWNKLGKLSNGRMKGKSGMRILESTPVCPIGHALARKISSRWTVVQGQFHRNLLSSQRIHRRR